MRQKKKNLVIPLVLSLVRAGSARGVCGRRQGHALLVHSFGLRAHDEAEEVLVGYGGPSGGRWGRGTALVVQTGTLARLEMGTVPQIEIRLWDKTAPVGLSPNIWSYRVPGTWQAYRRSRRQALHCPRWPSGGWALPGCCSGWAWGPAGFPLLLMTRLSVGPGCPRRWQSLTQLRRNNEVKINSREVWLHKKRVRGNGGTSERGCMDLHFLMALGCVSGPLFNDNLLPLSWTEQRWSSMRLLWKRLSRSKKPSSPSMSGLSR